MAVPQKRLRVSPSGPLADPNDTFPLEQLAGLVFRSPGDGSTDYRNVIGPPNAPDPLNLGISYRRSDGPARAASTYFDQPLTPQADTSSPFGLTPGIWRVQAHLTMGFNTTLPVGANYAALEGTFYALNDAGVDVFTVAYPQSPIPRDIGLGTAVDAATPGVVHSVTFEEMIVVSQDMIQANGGQPLPGLALEINRVSGNSAGVGPYTDTDSGWLEFTHDVSLVVNRYR